MAECHNRLTMVSSMRGDGKALWRCDCGTEKWIHRSAVRAGGTRSCGCLKREVNTERLKKVPDEWRTEYRIWCYMRNRCNNPNNKDYRHYGGRGISVCSEWESFRRFCTDLGHRPSSGHTLERLDNDKGYSPNNCVWADRKRQARNTRRSRFVLIEGQKVPLATALKGHNISASTFYYRVNNMGMTEAQALRTPLGPTSNRRVA